MRRSRVDLARAAEAGVAGRGGGWGVVDSERLALPCVIDFIMSKCTCIETSCVPVFESSTLPRTN
jgi:hypothetical protein